MSYEPARLHMLLADPILADAVWELWNAGVITNDVAAYAWTTLAAGVGD